jgi:hypothetical protein
MVVWVVPLAVRGRPKADETVDDGGSGSMISPHVSQTLAVGLSSARDRTDDEFPARRTTWLTTTSCSKRRSTRS